jgi:hypothetical protein
VNEIQLIRSQLAAERARAAAVAGACAATAARGRPTGGPPGEFVQACIEYLACVLAWFEERDQRAGDLVSGERPDKSAQWRTLAQALARPGRGREALEKLERATSADGDAATPARQPALWQEFTRYFETAWTLRRDAIDALLAAGLRAADWRAVAGIDADSILEERRRYARVRAALPAGVSLADSEAAATPAR